MSTEEIKRLEDEERELLLKLERARKARQDAINEHNKKLAEEALAKPVEIEVIDFTGAMVSTSSPYRVDLLAVFRSIPGRAYRGDRFNSIPVGEWSRFQEAVGKLKNVTLVYRDGVAEKIDRHLNQPVWEISLHQRWLHAVPGPSAQRWILGRDRFPGADWNTIDELYRIPLSEGWRLLETLKDVPGVVWEEAASAFVIEQAQKRSKLDEVAMMKQSDRFLQFDMNGCKLMPFQSVGVEFVDCAGGRALIGDEMGLGKTWQALAYALFNNLRTVVVCPASLKPNWAREIRKLSGQSPRILYGRDPSEYDLLQALTAPTQFSIINYDILRTKTTIKKDSGQIVSRFLWVELINMSKPDLVIVDEGHYIKNVDSNQSQALRALNTPRIVFLTGTPIVNRPGELWPMLHMIAPESFPAYETFLNQYTYDGKRVKNEKELRAMLRNIMIRRLKKDVIADLPKLRRITEYVELSEKAQKLYDKVLMGLFEKVAEWDAQGREDKKAVTNMLVQIMRLKQICSIDAIDRTAELATELYDQTDESSPRKVIIFSQFKAVAYAIYQRLADQGALCFVDRTPTEFKTVGNEERDKRVQQFQTDPSIKYLVVTEKTTKEGHNITAAGHVVFNDLFWAPTHHDQAIGRAYARLSDMHGVDAYFVIAQQRTEEDSIAEWNWELLGFKQGVIDQTIEGLDAERQESSIQMAIIEKLREAMWTRKKR